MNTLKRMFMLVLLVLPALGAMSLATAAQDSTATPETTSEEETRMGWWDECSTPDNLPEEITLGVVQALTGPVSVYGVPQQLGIQLAINEINEVDYLGEGVTLSAIYEDTVGDGEQAIAAMTKVVEEDQVTAVIGPTLSTEAFSADPIAQENGTPVMGITNAANGITDMGEYVFRVGPPESFVIPNAVKTVTETLDLERVAIIYGNDDDFTLSGYDVFVEALEENGVEIVNEQSFARGDIDFSAQLTSIVSDDPDALMVSALAAEAVQIIIQARQAGYNGPILGGNGLNAPAVLTETGEASNGVLVGASWNVAIDEPLSERVIALYEKEYDTLPDQFAVQAYTAVWLYATAIRCANSADRAEIRDELAAIQDFPSPLGLFSFSENRDPLYPILVQQVQDGEFIVFETDEE